MKSELHKKTRQLQKDLYIWKSWTDNARIFYTLKENDDNPKEITSEADITEIRKKAIPRPPPRQR